MEKSHQRVDGHRYFVYLIPRICEALVENLSKTMFILTKHINQVKCVLGETCQQQYMSMKGEV